MKHSLINQKLQTAAAEILLGVLQWLLQASIELQQSTLGEWLKLLIKLKLKLNSHHQEVFIIDFGINSCDMKAQFNDNYLRLMIVTTDQLSIWWEWTSNIFEIQMKNVVESNPEGTAWLSLGLNSSNSDLQWSIETKANQSVSKPKCFNLSTQLPQWISVCYC